MCKERPGPDSAPCLPTSSAISSILGTWLDQYSEDFCQPPDFPCLKQLVAYVQLNMPGSDLERRAHLLLAQLEHAGPPEAEPEGEKPGAGCVRCAGMGRCRPHREDPPEAGVGPEQGLESEHPAGGRQSGDIPGRVPSWLRLLWAPLGCALSLQGLMETSLLLSLCLQLQRQF